ncbi:RHS repeat domain-containing protein [Nonomuraea cavernae]|uniref:RHS repeat domain-containing protein n=1 Tax=Nonomuraea cavernae TaxID=2045107 RepID=UPI0033D1EFED
MLSRIVIVLTLLWSGLTLPAVEAVAAPAKPELHWRTALEKSDAAPGSPPVEKIRSAPEVDSTSAPKPKRTQLPAATSAEVRLDAKPQRVGPLEVSGAAGTTARVEVLEERASLPGLVFRISAATKVSVDFGSFAERYGAGYADRLKLVRLPECALTADCDRERAPSLKDGTDRPVVPSVKNGTKLSAEVPAGLFAVTAGPEGEEGSFRATPLALSGDWQVVTGSGNFAYNYDVPLQKAPAGPTPSLRLSYSSGTVDGMVSGKNTQSGPVGLGWGDFADSFIERRYHSCRADGQGSDDLCWKSDNATISLNGRSGELVPLPGTPTKQWRLKDDPRWRIEQLTGAKNGDNDGEHWKVTTPEGVQYFFGRGVNPDVVGVETHSVWTVPVFGDDAGEPCNAEAPLPWCVQAWRWNLDLVIDPHDNVQQYEYIKEINYYAALNGWPGFERTEYVRGGALHLLKYGKRRAANETEPSARVTFDLDYRCVDLAAACQEPAPATAANYPDTPVDLMCFTAVCTEHAPTFFTALRYVSLTTQVEVGGDEFVDVDRITLSHAFPDPDPNRTGDQKLYLAAIQRKGLSAEPQITMPPVTFFPVLLNNRVDTAGGLSAMPHYRVGVVTNETGGQVIVTYGRPHPCPSPIPNPPNWHLNTRNCFPHWHAPDGGTAGFAVFHKYVVTQVEQRDTVGGSPAMITSYKYGDQVRAGFPNGAWHHDRDEFVSNSNQTWSEWRGYADMLVAQAASRTQYRLFRGMNGDRLAGDPFPGPGSRVAKTSSLDGTVTNVNDDDWLAGGVLDQQELRGDGSVEHGTVTGYHVQRTVDAAGPDPLDDAWFVMPNDWVERRRNPVDGSMVRSRSQTVYNGLLGTADKVIDHGWLASTGDERCTVTVPTVNSDRWLLDLPASVTRYGNATCDGAELAREEFAYDGGAFGATPTRGDQTGSRVKLTAAPTWATTTTTYDRLGRPLTVTDPNGRTTTTAHTPAIRYPATTTVTNSLGHRTTTTWFRPRQAPEATFDARGKKTTFAYDALGRTRTVHRPTEQGGSASHEFAYDLDPDRAKPGVVRTRRLQDTTRYVDSWVLHDSWLRPRQAHTLSPESGKAIVSDTRYEGRGLVAATSQPQALTGAAGAGLFPIPAGGWANDETTAHDELRRPIWQVSSAAGTIRRSVVTDYTYDSVTTTPHPQAGGVVRTVSDAHGRVIRMEERDGTAWRLTRYGYDQADRLTTITDPAGNTITNTYDLAGRKIAMNDPDMGAWTYGFDAAGNQTRATNAAGGQVHTLYDALSRPKERRKDSPAGTLLAKWEYDATGETGLLNRTTRVEGGDSYVVDVTGYDGRARPTGQTWTFPDASYTVGYGYDAADHPTRITYPAVGGLPAETVNTTYNDVGLATSMAGAAEYVWSALYDDRARSVWNLSGSRTVPFSRMTEYDADQRVKAIKAGGGNTTLQDLRFTYDDTFGHVVDRLTTLNGQSWRECFDHDDRQRLTRAFTTTGTCTAGTPGTGANAYDHTYTLSADGNLTRRVESGTQIAYTYPTAGGTRPHAPTAVGGNTYTWNANGDLASRTVSGRTETLTWSPERLLLAAGTSSFVYDADGKRLQRKTPAGTTRYIDGHEITGSKAVRTYSFNGTPIAIRTATRVEFLATDNQGSVQLTVPAGSETPSHIRSYQPYGKPRGTDRADTDRGWISQIEDSSTGLNYLNARYYDPSMGRFVSPDPLFDVARPQTINPYAYGLNNPTAFSDPSGLIPDDCANGKVTCTHNGKGWTNAQPTPKPAPAIMDACAPGTPGNTECGSSLEGSTITGGEDLTVDDLAERVVGGTDNALDVLDLGLEFCTDSHGCARITEFFAVADDIGYAVGAIGLVMDCGSEGFTSQACVKGAVLTGGQLIPGVGVIFLTLDVLDQFGLVDPVIDALQEMFTSDGRSPVRTCDSGSRPEYGCTHLPSGGQGEYTGSAGVPPPCTGCAAPQAGPCPLRGCDHNSYNLND